MQCHKWMRFLLRSQKMRVVFVLGVGAKPFPSAPFRRKTRRIDDVGHLTQTRVRKRHVTLNGQCVGSTGSWNCKNLTKFRSHFHSVPLPSPRDEKSTKLNFHRKSSQTSWNTKILKFYEICSQKWFR